MARAKFDSIRPVRITCHVATWMWAALAAQMSQRGPRKTPMDLLGDIGAMNPACQPAILQVMRTSTWDFDATPGTPPVGSVLLWTDGATHSAVVSGPNLISGYNQCVQFPVFQGNVGHTHGHPDQIGVGHRQCVVISEATMLEAARRLLL